MRNEIYKTTFKAIEINGHVLEAKVSIETSPDYLDIDDLIDPVAFPEQAKILAKDLESGNASCLVVFVKASALGEEGTDCLCGCIVYQPSDVDSTVKEYSMTETSLEDLKDKITQKYDLLKPLFTK